MKQYDSLLKRLITLAEAGDCRPDRTGVGTVSIFSAKMMFNMERLSICTRKKIHYKSIVKELLWFLRGETNVNSLKSKIWNEWADEDGNLGPIYGKQWRAWSGYSEEEGAFTIDQISELVESLSEDPYSRRHILSAWNVGELDHMRLKPCHVMAAFYVEGNGEDRKLNCFLLQRSGDMFLGVPYNIVSYSLLASYLCARVSAASGIKISPGRLSHNIVDCHLYLNHIEQAKRYLSLPDHECSRRLVDINRLQKLPEELKESDFALDEYVHGPYIKAPVAV